MSLSPDEVLVVLVLLGVSVLFFFAGWVARASLDE